MQLRTDDVSWRDVEDDVVVLDEQTWKYVHLNASASALWRALAEGPRSEDELAALLVESFAISPERAQADVASFAADLRARSYLEG